MSLTERSIPLIGEEGLKKLNASSVLVMGVGGVGSWCAEALTRCGIGKITVLDNDTVSETNRNRQSIALVSTVGRSKAAVCAERLRDINPDCEVECIEMFYGRETESELDLTKYDYIADCIDTVTAKLILITRASEKNIPIVSSMGTGNRLDPSRITVKDIYSTSGDPLSRVMRKELRARGVERLAVVCSDEQPCDCVEGRSAETGRATPASACFVPATAGFRMAYHIVTELIK